MTRQAVALWTFICCLTLIDVFGLWIEGITLTKDFVFCVSAPVIFLSAVSFIEAKLRRAESICLLTEMVAATLAFMVLSCLLSYLVISFKAPLIDAYLLAFDRYVNFHWLDLYKWVTQRPILWIAMKLVYMLLLPEIFVCQIILIYRHDFARAWEALWLFSIVSLLTVVSSGFFPAEGAFAVFHVELGEPYVREFAALRDGSLKLISMPGGLKGIVEFPSFHMALALLFPYVVRGIRIVSPLFIALNSLIMLTMPTIGGHYLSDLLAGALLTCVVIIVFRLFKPRSERRGLA